MVREILMDKKKTGLVAIISIILASVLGIYFLRFRGQSGQCIIVYGKKLRVFNCNSSSEKKGKNEKSNMGLYGKYVCYHDGLRKRKN